MGAMPRNLLDMDIQETAVPGVLLLTPRKFTDARGAFWETYNERFMRDAGLPTQWKQDNTSVSFKNVVRGIHYQVAQAQGKLVRVTYGAVFDVAVDLRRSSKTFGRHMHVELSEENGAMLWIPPGFGHGFAVLSEKAGFAYKVTDYYSPSDERTILWNDPKLAIPWPLNEQEAIVSAKDRQGSFFHEAEVFS
jgi:dTDP-4-dehydrorhamnose 3,5-epimerase